MGPTNSWKILSDDKWVMVPNRVGCFKWWVMSDEWWVMKTEWWVIDDENWVMSDHFFKPNKALLIYIHKFYAVVYGFFFIFMHSLSFFLWKNYENIIKCILSYIIRSLLLTIYLTSLLPMLCTGTYLFVR